MMSDMVSEEAIPCIWSDTVENVEYTDGKGRPGNRNLYGYTQSQMEALVDTIDNLREKYSTGIWQDDLRAHELLRALNIYHNKNKRELDAMLLNPTPPVEHSAQYQQKLLQKFTEFGRKGRYSRPKVEKMTGYWARAKSVFDNADSQ